jgi:hypothetical protein
MDNEDRQDLLRRPSVKRTIGWYGKRRITNGHRSCNGQTSTSYYPWTKTPERTAGAIKIKGWWRRGDIKATKCKKTKECWVKFPVNVPSEVAKDIKEALITPGQNYGKDRYTIDLTGSEATYWVGTESGLLGAFHFDGACTAGDGSCDVQSLSMGAGFCYLNPLEWLTGKPLTRTRVHEERSNQSHKVGREEEGMSSNRPELVALRDCLEAHPDKENLLYLTDSEATLQP